jgi:hypothetical protein
MFSKGIPYKALPPSPIAGLKGQVADVRIKPIILNVGYWVHMC